MTSPADRVNTRIAARSTVSAARVAFIAATIAAIVSGLGVYFGNVEAARQTAASAEKAALLERRVSVYEDLLKQADATMVAATRVDASFDVLLGTSRPGASDNTGSVVSAATEEAGPAGGQVAERTRQRQVIDDAEAAYAVARNALQVSANRVFVFGTDDAWADADELVDTLPPATSRYMRPPTTQLDAPGLGDPAWDPEVYNERYLDFLRTFCREASSQPREGCRGAD